MSQREPQDLIEELASTTVWAILGIVAGAILGGIVGLILVIPITALNIIPSTHLPGGIVAIPIGIFLGTLIMMVKGIAKIVRFARETRLPGWARPLPWIAVLIVLGFPPGCIFGFLLAFKLISPDLSA